MKVKLNPLNYKYELENWEKYLKENMSEVLESLIDENVTIEGWFLEKCKNGEVWLYAFWDPINSQEASNVAKSSSLLIDKVHKNFKQACWIKGSKVKIEQLFVADLRDKEEQFHRYYICQKGLIELGGELESRINEIWQKARV